MAKRKRETTENQIQAWIKEGRGQGRTEKYKPWLNIQDVSSRGLSYRSMGTIVPRTYHLLSQQETRYFYELEATQLMPNMPTVIDIREQVPLLPKGETLRIAETIGVKHPTDPKTQVPTVMTTDFVYTTLKGHEQVDHARAVKMSKDLQRKRVCEKLEIERIFWEKRGVEWGIVTEQDINIVVSDNMKFFQNYLSLQGYPLSEQDFETIRNMLDDRVFKYTLALRELCSDCDASLGYKPGSSLIVAYHLIASGEWKIDIAQRFDPAEPIEFTR